MPLDRSSPGAFWEFSLAFYAVPGVADACLTLQDRNGADVNVLLYLLYAAQAGRALSPADIAAIDALARPWREAIVLPLRTARRALKATIGRFEPAATARLRDELKRVELHAERLQQQTLERLAPPGTPRASDADVADCARAHLNVYGRTLGSLDAAAANDILDAFGRRQAASGHGDGGHDTIGRTN
jgi:uncharacterized protein (TIGR02444 family)